MNLKKIYLFIKSNLYLYDSLKFVWRISKCAQKIIRDSLYIWKGWFAVASYIHEYVILYKDRIIYGNFDLDVNRPRRQWLIDKDYLRPLFYPYRKILKLPYARITYSTFGEQKSIGSPSTEFQIGKTLRGM